MIGGYLLIEPILFYLGLALSCGFLILFVVFILFLGKMPKAAKAIITCWLKRRTLVIDANEVGQFMFKPFIRKGHEGQLERDIGGGWTEVRLVPRHSNPIVATPYVLEDTGIPCLLSYSPKAIVFTPKMLAAMTVVNTPVDQRKGLSKSLIEWAEKTNMPIELQEEFASKLVDKEGEPLTDEKTGDQLVKIDHRTKTVKSSIVVTLHLQTILLHQLLLSL